jgi:hypothetical protein
MSVQPLGYRPFKAFLMGIIKLEFESTADRFSPNQVKPGTQSSSNSNLQADRWSPNNQHEARDSRRDDNIL